MSCTNEKCNNPEAKALRVFLMKDVVTVIIFIVAILAVYLRLNNQFLILETRMDHIEKTFIAQEDKTKESMSRILVQMREMEQILMNIKQEAAKQDEAKVEVETKPTKKGVK